MSAAAAARAGYHRAAYCSASLGAKRRDAGAPALSGWTQSVSVPRVPMKYLFEGSQRGSPTLSATGEEARAVPRTSETEHDESKTETTETPSPPKHGSYSGEEDGVSSGADALRAVRDLPVPKISTDDAHFLEKLGVTFRWGLRHNADLEELNSLFASVGFPRRDETRLRKALVHSHDIVWVIVANKKNKSSGVFVGQCVGFARVTSDGAFNATIWDVVVCPKWQGCGLGKAMVERLTERLIKDDIQNVSLYAEPAVVGLYQKCGFEDNPGGTTGMAFRHHRRKKQAVGGVADNADSVSVSNSDSDSVESEG
ncbi:GNAT family N-acetyltransferase [bacterium]|nr:GNAT family N-acetyltransferase [bacterium]